MSKFNGNIKHQRLRCSQTLQGFKSVALIPIILILIFITGIFQYHFYRKFSKTFPIFRKILNKIRPMFTVVDDASNLIVPSNSPSSSIETSSSKRHQAAFRPAIQEVPINQLEAVHSVINPIKTRINEKMSPKKEYRFRSRLKFHWERTGYLPCSATCESGHQESVIGCFNKYGIQVHENHCDAKRRPPIVRRQCASLTCLPRWEASEWSQCSTSCGPGKLSTHLAPIKILI